MENKPVQMFESKCQKARIFCDNDMAIGVFHDFLMEMKGLMVDRMVAAHKEQIQVMEAQRKQDVDPEVK
jgi:hypothetical protein